MEDHTSETPVVREETKQPAGPAAAAFLTTPIAVLIAGILIAAAIYTSGSPATVGVRESDGGVAGANVAAPNQPEAAEPAVGEVREVTSADHIRGAGDAKLTIIEYSDLECPFCKRFHGTLKQVLAEYPDDVRWVYRHFPLAQLHAQARTEALAAECAGEQGRFWEFVDLVFETTQGNDSLDLAKLPDYAQQVGVANISQFESCVESEKFAEKVDADLADAQAAGGRGTPYSVIVSSDGTKTPISGAQPFESVKATIESLL